MIRSLHRSVFVAPVFVTGIVAVAGCGGSDGGSNPDAASDANAADAEPTAQMGPCGIAAGETVLPATVVFSAPDGTLIGSAELDSEGEATRDDCVDNTIITLARDISSTASLVSFFGVPIGATVRWLDFEVSESTEVVITPATDAPAADAYKVRACAIAFTATTGSAAAPIIADFSCERANRPRAHQRKLQRRPHAVSRAALGRSPSPPAARRICRDGDVSRRWWGCRPARCASGSCRAGPGSRICSRPRRRR